MACILQQRGRPDWTDKAALGGEAQLREDIDKTPHVLLVEDDAWIRTFLRDVLSDAGYAVLEAADGRTGLRLAEQQCPDVILLDLAMPELTGVDVIRRLGERLPAAGIPVVVMSAFLDVIPLVDRERVAGILPKPIDVSDLLVAIRRALEDSHF